MLKIKAFCNEWECPKLKDCKQNQIFYILSKTFNTHHMTHSTDSKEPLFPFFLFQGSSFTFATCLCLSIGSTVTFITQAYLKLYANETPKPLLLCYSTIYKNNLLLKQYQHWRIRMCSSEASDIEKILRIMSTALFSYPHVLTN